MLRLATPVVVIQVGMMLMGVVDTIMVGHISAVALAAVALGNLYFFGLGVFGMGTLMVLDPVVAQAVGARDEPAIARGDPARQSSWRSCSASRYAPAAPGRAVHDAGAAAGRKWSPHAAAYAVRLAPGVLPFFLFIVLRQSLQSMHLHRADHGRDRRGQPGQRGTQLGADLRPPRLPGPGRDRLGLGHDHQPLAAAPAPARSDLAAPAAPPPAGPAGDLAVGCRSGGCCGSGFRSAASTPSSSAPSPSWR